MKIKLFILALLVSTAALPQERKILGRILDAETQKPIKDANIAINGTTKTFSNLYGYFELAVDTSKIKTLIASHIGFTTIEVPIPAADRFKFSMQKEYILLNRLNLNDYPAKLPPRPGLAESERSGPFNTFESGAKFPDGLASFYHILGNALNVNLPQVNETGFNVTFTINELGKPGNISISDSTTKHVVESAIDNMPNWTPALQRENNVPQHFILPVVRIISQPQVFGALFNFIGANIKYPAKARKLEVTGTVYVEFQLDNYGNILAIKLLNEIGGDCGLEVKRVMASVPRILPNHYMTRRKPANSFYPFPSVWASR